MELLGEYPLPVIVKGKCCGCIQHAAEVILGEHPEWQTPTVKISGTCSS